MTLKVAIDSISDQQWESAAGEFSDYSIYQTRPYQQTRAEVDRQSLRHVVVTNDAGQTVLMAHVRVKNIPLSGLKIGYVQRGPLVGLAQVDPVVLQEAFGLLRESLFREGISVLRIVPNIRNNEEGKAFAKMLYDLGWERVDHIRPYQTLVVSLDRPEEEIRGGLSKSFRRNLNKAEKTLVVQEGRGQEYSDLLETFYAALRDRKHFKGLDPKEFIATQKQLCESEKMDYIVTYQEDESISIHLISNLGDSGVSLLAAGADRKPPPGSSELLWWRSLQSALKAGMKHFDLGGINPDTNPHVYEFKSRMGGDEMYLIGAFESYAGSYAKGAWRLLDQVHRRIKK